jgi:glutamate dehydrogenase
VRARVIAEGGNLGVTQKGRIEYWTEGGLCNTDAVDNSGGVDMSDHEVNIKILLDLLVRSGVISGPRDRNALLAELTDDVSELVLADNRNQARAITLDGLRSAKRHEDFVALIDRMVAAKQVSREDEDIPTREELMAGPARDRGLARPLLAVLMGYTKMCAFTEVLQSDWVSDDSAGALLEAYFPDRLDESHREHYARHPLRREIAATVAVNYLVNFAGISFIDRVSRATGADTGEVVKAYLDADRETGSADERQQTLTAGLPPEQEHERLLAIEEKIEAAVLSKLGARRELAAAGIGRRR